MSRQRECCVCLFRHDQQSRTNVHFLVFHLTIADTIISFITMPMEIIWRIIIEVVLKTLMLMLMLQWHAGNVACKVLMMIRTGGYILSSLMLIVLSVDRFIIVNIVIIATTTTTNIFLRYIILVYSSSYS